MFDLINLITTAGYLGLFGIIFAETGLLIGFFLPGDSLLFTAGFLASQGILSLPILMFGSFIAAVVGDSVGYAFGKKIGSKIFNKEDSIVFNKDHVVKTQLFFGKYGAKTIILARFVPIVRTFAPIMAGVGTMKYRVFLMFNIIGGGLWTLGISALGYYLGKTIPGVDQYLLPIILLIIVVSMLPNFIEIYRDKTLWGRLWAAFMRIINKIMPS